MTINIISKNITLYPSLIKKMKHKMEALFDVNNRLSYIAISLKKEGVKFVVTIRAHFKGFTEPMVINQKDGHIYSAFGKAKQRLKTQVLESQIHKRNKKRSYLKDQTKIASRSIIHLNPINNTT